MLGATIGPYRLIAELGSGGMGSVFLGEVLAPVAGLPAGARVAVKLVHPQLVADPSVVRRFHREARVGMAVDHPNVVRTLDVGVHADDGGETHYLAMEMVRGQTLRDLLRDEGVLPEELVRHLGREVARALEAIHAAGVVHRDLKPENILITHDQEVRVMDLGVARLHDEATRLTRTGAFVGSLHYAAPEQLREGGDDLDGRVDLYALGATLYEAATGTRAHGRGDFGVILRRVMFELPPRAATIAPDLTTFLDEVIHRLLAKERDERFPTAREVRDILVEGEHCTWWRCRAVDLQQSPTRPRRRLRVARDTALVGRSAELTRLEEAYRGVAQGRGRVILLEGEAGIGKTRLVDECLSRLEAAGETPTFLFGSYPPVGAAAADGAFSTAFREHLGTEGLEEALRSHLTGASDLVPAFAAVLRGESQPRGGAPLSRDALASVFVRLTRRLAAERPLVLLVDDLHFAPEQGRALFASLALAAADLPLLLVGTARPGLPRDWLAGVEHLPYADRISLGRLGEGDLARLLVEALGSEALARELGRIVARKSDGNPFFVFEVLRGLREGQFIARQDDGTWVQTRVVDDIRIPSSVFDLIQARIQDLDEEDRDILDVASCCGYDFDPLIVGDVMGLAPIPLLKRLGRLEREHGLVRSVGVRCVFDHHQVQEALYESQSELLRREYHGALAAALERRERAGERDPEELPGAVAYALADHLLRAARGEEALRYVERALDYLEDSYLNDAAVALVQRVEDIPGLLQEEGRLRVLIRKADRLELLGRWEEERNALDTALRQADADGEPSTRSRVRRRLGRHLCRMGHFSDALTMLEEALELATEAGDRREEGAILSTLGVVCWHLGRFEEAQAHHDRTLAITREVGPIETDSASTGNLPDLLASLGRAEEAREHTRRQLALAKEGGDRRGEAIATGNLGGLLYDAGDYREARDQFARALDLARTIGDRRGEARAAGNLGRVLRDLGRFDEALGHLEAARTIAREIGYRRGEARAQAHLARIDRDLGRPDAARRRIGRYLELARAMGARSEEAHALREQAILEGQNGDPAAADALFAEALAAWEATTHLAGRASTHIAFARHLIADGRPDDARLHIEEAQVLAAEVGAADEIVLAALLRAALPGGAPEAAARAFRAHASRLRRPECMEACYRLFLLTGDESRLDEARRILDEIAAHAPEAARTTLRGAVPLHRAIDDAWDRQSTATRLAAPQRPAE